MMHCFGIELPRYKGTVAILAERLRNLQWSYEGDGIWDFRGARIHIFMSSPRHIQFLLERSWLTYICDKIRHRKYLGNVSSICRMNLRHHSELSSSQKALVDFQSCGEQFTNDAKKYSVMSVRLAPSVTTVMIADYIVLRNALSSNRSVESFHYFSTTGRHFQCRPRRIPFGPNRRCMISFYAFYIAFHSHMLIDWRMTTFTLHLRMDHVNGKSTLTSVSAPLRLLKCSEMEVVQWSTLGWYPDNKVYTGGKSSPVLLRCCVFIMFAFLRTTRLSSRLPRKSFTATFCNSPSTFLRRRGTYGRCLLWHSLRNHGLK